MKPPESWRWVVLEVELPQPADHACGPDCLCFVKREQPDPEPEKKEEVIILPERRHSRRRYRRGW